jgi:ppGpp synthetase/RelA/SpoT-type nucleotidyltranferase
VERAIEPTAPREDFDFELHRQKSVDAFAKVRPLYEDFATVVRNILRETFERKGIKSHSIEARAKSLESFGQKAMSPSDSDINVPKYPSPLTQITDLAGVRVITFFPKTLEEVDKNIREQFYVMETVDHTKSLHEAEQFGYQSVHYLVKLKADRIKLPEYQKFDGVIAEIQIRTVLQHAWAEIEHDIQYKSNVTIPEEIRRRFMALAGMLEIADREFQAIQDDDLSLRVQARQLVSEGNLEKVEITPDALKSYLDRKLGPDDRMADFSYDWTARLLRQLGFTNFRQVDECIKNYDDNRLSRAVYGNRQGQLTRFELLLTAAMGSNFFEQHPWRGLPWFKESWQRRFERLKETDIPIGSYRPEGSL